MRRWLAIVLALVPSLALPAGAQAFGISEFAVAIHGEGETIDSEAGSHPVSLSVEVGFRTEGVGPYTEGDVRDLSLELPPGLIENPTVVPPCSQADFLTPRSSRFEESLSGESCPQRSQVGTVTLRSSFGGGAGETRTFGLFNLQPPPGAPSELGANPYGAPIVLVPSIRQAEGEYGLTLVAENLPQLVDLTSIELEIWGVPWSVLHNDQRGECLNEAEPSFGWSKCSVGPPRKAESTPRAYLTLPTSCEGQPSFRLSAESWQGESESRSVQTPALEGCQTLAFDPHIAAQLSDPRASSPSGYAFDLDVDDSGVTEAHRRAPSPIKKAVVALPEGVTINPSVGAGLGVCTPAQFAAETPTSPPGAGCPNESKVGDFNVHSPIVAGPIEGAIFLAAPGENPFGSLLAVYLVAKSTQRGVLVKVAGELRADEVSGRLTATFDRLPQLPYHQLEIHFREGQRSPLATPAACGTFQTAAEITPWRDATLTKHESLPLQITAGLGGGPCPQGLAPFAPQAKGGTLNSNAGSYTPFYLDLKRTDTEQEIVSYSATFPPGLLGKIAGVPYCPEQDIQAAARNSGVGERDHPSCPAASLIGHTYSGYGLGPVLAYAPGNLYLAGPYRGSSFSVVAIDSALVGPFDLGTVIVRSAVRIDPETAQASIDATGTDPIPHIIDGIPIHLRDVRAYIDRPQFTLNPTSCEPFAVSSALNGAGEHFGDQSDDTLATATAPFQAFNCDALGFRPSISLALKGGSRRAKHPALRVIVRPRPGDANIASSQVALPSSLFLDQGHITGICTRPQFARHECPPSSVYGHVRAVTPLLEEPLSGEAILRSSDHTLPDLVFTLRGHGIEVDLAGRIDSVKGGLRGTFPVIPDAPVTKFELTMGAGRHGLLVVSAKSLCSGTQLANSRFMGHANQGVSWHPQIRIDCKKGTKGKIKRGRVSG
jgi:hypothetical protein